jgi:hypothetical protein
MSAPGPFDGDGKLFQVIRTVTENSRTLKFDTHGFERE